MGTHSLEEVLEEVKKAIVELIIEWLRGNLIDVEHSRKLAADFLAELPIKDIEDLLDKLQRLRQTHKLALLVYDQFTTKDLALENAQPKEESDLPKNNSKSLSENRKTVTLMKTNESTSQFEKGLVRSAELLPADQKPARAIEPGEQKKGNTGRITKRSDKIRSRRVVDEQFASDPSKIIVEVLSIIGYENDKDVYAAEFIDLAEKQALLDCLQAIPSDKQKAFKQQMSQATQQEDVKDIIKQYVSTEEYTEALKAAFEDAFTRFIETLIPELHGDQLDQLERYLRTLRAYPKTERRSH